MSRALSPLAALLSVFILASSPVYAGPVVIKDVIQVVGSHQNAPELRLRSFSQTAGAPISSALGSTRAASNVSSVDADVSLDSTGLWSGLSVSPGNFQSIDLIDDGDVEATICDCGEITVAAGAFPKWSLLFLGAIPLIFIDGGDDCTTCPDSTPTPTPLPSPSPFNTPQVPEPTSLLLFGSGLAAFGTGLLRRYANGKLAAKVEEARK